MNRTTLALFALLACCLLGRLAHADIIVFTDGRTLEGDVLEEDGDEYVVKGRFGIVRIPRHQVAEIKKQKSKREIYDERLKALNEKKDATGEEFYQLGAFAHDHKLDLQAKQMFEKAVALDKEHKGAHEALGHVRYLGEWVPLEKKMAAEGKVKVGERWMTKEEAETLERDKTDLVTPALPTNEKPRTPVKSALEKCVTCDGTGVGKWLTCLQCKRSGTPGYLNMGERMQLCTRCQGKAKLPGLPCSKCFGKGKIDPNKVFTPAGRVIPTGYKLCGGCNGSGVAHWLKCNQCARSDEPGFLNMGEYMKVCDRCHGKARIPGTPCATCQGRQIVRE